MCKEKNSTDNKIFQENPKGIKLLKTTTQMKTL